LAEAKNHNERIIIIERFLISRLSGDKPDLLIQSAITNIQQSNGSLRINELLKRLPLSRDAFEKRFRKTTSTTPKQFASIVRLNSVIDTLHPHSNLTDTALSAGYFDQSHFIKDFTAFTGQLPHDFIRQPRKW